MTKITARQVATKLGCEPDDARNLIRFLEVKGLFTKTGETVPAEGGKGKGQNVYEFDEGKFVTDMTQVIVKLVRE